MSETVLVTGGSGYVGGWCIATLLNQGYRVRTTLRSPGKEAALRRSLAAVTGAAEELIVHIADLTRDAGWDEAVAGCDFVLHVASPLGGSDPKDPNELIVPARDGTLRVLGAAIRAGVKRVVMTSSLAAASAPIQGPDSHNDESVWTDLQAEKLTAYRQSKVISERAAWDFMASQGGRTELTTLLPGAILGPVLSKENLGSVQLIQRLLDGKLPGYPRLGFNLVDVRDLAQAHVLAMTSEQAGGERFVTVGDFMWMADIARILRERLGARARRVPTRSLPDLALRVAAFFDPALRSVTPNLGKKHTSSSAKARRLLGWQARPAETTVVDCAESLLDPSRDD